MAMGPVRWWSATAWNRVRRRHRTAVSPVWSWPAPRPYRLSDGPGVGTMPGGPRGPHRARVRLEEQGRGQREAEGVRGLQVDDQLEVRGLLHREFGWLGALQDLVHVGGGPSEERPAPTQAPRPRQWPRH